MLSNAKKTFSTQVHEKFIHEKYGIITGFCEDEIIKSYLLIEDEYIIDVPIIPPGPSPIPTLATPPVDGTATGQTTISVVITAVPNATSYRTTFNGVLKYTGPLLSYSVGGLSPSTIYNIATVATAPGYNDSAPGTDTVTTDAVPVVEIFFGYTDEEITAPETVTLQFSKEVLIGVGSYSLDFTSAVFSGDKYLVVKEPITEPIKTAWFNTSLNSQPTGSIPGFVYNMIEVDDDRYYYTNNVADVNSSTSIITYSP